MKHYRCACGKAIMWNSGEMIHACEGCEECGTTYAQHPKEHHVLEPHEYSEIKKVEYVDGVKIITDHYLYCKLCYHRKKLGSMNDDIKTNKKTQEKI